MILVFERWVLSQLFHSPFFFFLNHSGHHNGYEMIPPYSFDLYFSSDYCC